MTQRKLRKIHWSREKIRVDRERISMVDIITHQCELGGSRNILNKRENFRNEKN